MQNSFRLLLRMLFYMLRTLALRLAFGAQLQNCKLNSMQNTFRLRLGISVHLFVLKVSPATQVLLSIPPYVYNAVS